MEFHPFCVASGIPLNVLTYGTGRCHFKVVVSDERRGVQSLLLEIVDM